MVGHRRLHCIQMYTVRQARCDGPSVSLSEIWLRTRLTESRIEETRLDVTRSVFRQQGLERAPRADGRLLAVLFADLHNQRVELIEVS